MQKAGARIDPDDSVVLFVDVQQGIVELSRTIPLERLEKGVLALSKLAKIFGITSDQLRSRLESHALRARYAERSIKLL